MVVGNVFGSNVFNFMLVLPMSWLVVPLQMPPVFLFDLLFFILILLIIFILSYRTRFFNFIHGVILFAAYLIYLYIIYFR